MPYLVKCIQRWEKVLRPDLVKGKWTEEEDIRLKDVVFEGFEHWGKVADRMPGRTSKQCRERWANYLDPTLLKTPFTPIEDEAVLRLQGELGNKWACIARHVPGRTENSVKLRFHALMKQYGGDNNQAKHSISIAAAAAAAANGVIANNSNNNNGIINPELGYISGQSYSLDMRKSK